MEMELPHGRAAGIASEAGERPEEKERIFNYFPAYNKDLEPKDFAKVNLMFHHQLDAIENLKTGFC